MSAGEHDDGMNQRLETDLDVDPDVPALSDLRTRSVFRPNAVRIDAGRLREIIRELNLDVDLDVGTPQLELTARQPYAPAGFIDMYQPGRWDCEFDTVFMSAIVQTGPSPGQWDGTAAYARFTAPAPGTYIVVVNFSGYQQTMRLNGPWGVTTAHCATTSDSAATSALWTAAAADETLYCTFSSKSDSGLAGIAYLQSFQVFTPAT
jgi:hypothetical protein